MTILDDIDRIDFNAYAEDYPLVAEFVTAVEEDNFYFARSTTPNSGNSSRPDHVMSWGANLNCNSLYLTDDGEGHDYCATGFTIEAYYNPGGYECSEVHLNRLDPYQPSEARRPWTWEFRQGAHWTHELAADYFSIFDRLGKSYYARFQQAIIEVMPLNDEDGFPATGYSLRTFMDSGTPLTMISQLGSSDGRLRVNFTKLEFCTDTIFDQGMEAFQIHRSRNGLVRSLVWNEDTGTDAEAHVAVNSASTYGALSAKGNTISVRADGSGGLVLDVQHGSGALLVKMAGQDAFKINPDLSVQIPSLTGTGTRAVKASSTGVLSAP